jgi:hypothetical protein
MYDQVEKSKENKSRAVANSVAQKKSKVKQGFGFVDNRPEAVAQRKLQEVANNNQHAKQVAQLQLMANLGSPIQLYLTTHDNGYGDITGGGLDSDTSTETEVATLIASWDATEGNEAIAELTASIPRRQRRYDQRGDNPFVGDPDGVNHLARINQERDWLVRLNTKKDQVAADAQLARENAAAVEAEEAEKTGLSVSITRRDIGEGWGPRTKETLQEVAAGPFVTTMIALTGVSLTNSVITNETTFRLTFTITNLGVNGAEALRTANGVPLVVSTIYA